MFMSSYCNNERLDLESEKNEDTLEKAFKQMLKELLFVIPSCPSKCMNPTYVGSRLTGT